jgi:histidyl-tRNA synthetase
MISRVRGTRDIIDGIAMEHVCMLLEKHLKNYRYSKIYLPLIESLALFKRSLGQETDVVSKEMFVVTSSSGQADEEICLRPEATASTVRAFVENGIQQTPWKVFTIGEMFRYERPQKGRFRQFYQCSMEVIGSACVTEDVLFIYMLNSFFSKVCGFLEYGLHINYLGCHNDRSVLKEKLYAFLEFHTDTLCETCKKRKESNILRIFDCKSEVCQNLYKNAPVITDCLCAECNSEWVILQNQLEELSVPFFHNARLVRGLDYYNKTVFEFVSPLLGSQSTFCGGGRYDGLVQAIGGKEDQPSIGAAIGIDRILLMFEALDKSFIQDIKPLYVVLPLSLQEHSIALQIVNELHNNDFCADILFDKSIKNMMRKANKLGAKYCLLVGSEEAKNGMVTVKNMVTGQEDSIKQLELSSFLKKI